MGSKATNPAINGSGRRKCDSWIEAFVKYTDNIESAEVFRRWTAITCIAAALEQKVWISTSSRLYPNLYTLLIGPPGVGKSRTIFKAQEFLSELPEFKIAPTSMTMASMVQALLASKRSIVNLPGPMIEFNSMTILADEWSTFMHKYDDEMIAGLTKFYDVGPYERWRINKDEKTKIPRPQLSILAGSTSVKLLKYMPEYAWDDGFASRMILVYNGDKRIGDDFSDVEERLPPPEMLHDLKIIFALQGQFTITDEFRRLVLAWRENDEAPKPSHPKLVYYNNRRRANLYKLAMVSSVDRGNSLTITDDDFHVGLNWLKEVEPLMERIFEEGSSNVDAKAMDEIADFVSRQGRPVPKHRVVRFTSSRVPAHTVLKLLDVMIHAGRIVLDAEGGTFTAPVDEPRQAPAQPDTSEK